MRLSRNSLLLTLCIFAAVVSQTACDTGESEVVILKLPHSLEQADGEALTESVASDAGIKRISPWRCTEPSKPKYCPKGTKLEAWFQGRGQTLVLEMNDRVMQFGISRLPGRLARETHNELDLISRSLQKKYGVASVAKCSGGECDSEYIS